MKILIVDDQHLFAESLKFVLQGESGGKIEVVGIAGNGSQAVDMTESLDPDIILMDIRMPIMDGVEATTRIHATHPEKKVIILTTFDDDELAVSALSNGACGYILKDVYPQDLIKCIEAVAQGGYYISPSVGIKMFDSGKSTGSDTDDDRDRMIMSYIRQLPQLSRRECEILYFVARVKNNQEIADALFIAQKTVKNHINSIYAKLEIHNRLQLINYTLSLSDHGDNSAMHKD